MPGVQRQANSKAQTKDTCAGWENDRESFSIHSARFVATTQINPIIGRELASTNCHGPYDCDVTFDGGQTIRLMWNTHTRRVLAKFQSGSEIKRFVYSYACPAGQLTLTFIQTHHTPAPGGTGDPAMVD